MGQRPNIHRGVPDDEYDETMVWCENCGDGFPEGEPMFNLDDQLFCSRRCLVETIEVMSDDCDTHEGLAALHQGFAERIARITEGTTTA